MGFVEDVVDLFFEDASAEVVMRCECEVYGVVNACDFGEYLEVAFFGGEDFIDVGWGVEVDFDGGFNGW